MNLRVGSQEIVFMKNQVGRGSGLTFIRKRAERRDAWTSRRGRSGVLELLTSVDITLRETGGDGTGTEEGSENTYRPIECRVILYPLGKGQQIWVCREGMIASAEVCWILSPEFGNFLSLRRIGG
jgi:hypothetical protein